MFAAFEAVAAIWIWVICGPVLLLLWLLSLLGVHIEFSLWYLVPVDLLFYGACAAIKRRVTDWLDGGI